MGTITCSYCDRELPPSDFPKKNRSRCKNCLRIYQHEYRTAKRCGEWSGERLKSRIEKEEMLSANRLRCAGCEQVLSVDDFFNDRYSITGKQSKCKKCQQATMNTLRIKRSRGELTESEINIRVGLAEYGRMTCKACHRELPLQEFSNNSGAITGKCTTCKDCNSDLLARKPGATYGAMLENQGYTCAICGSTNPGSGKKRFAVDHDHATGEIRGLLCHACNMGIGLLQDDISVMRKAIEYLEESYDRT